MAKKKRKTGTKLPLELIAGANPYGGERLTALPVTLLWQGEPIGDIQISIFQNNGQITRTTTRTDAEGRAMVSLDGGGVFLLSAVHLQAAAPEGEVEWESHWASLTFEVASQSK